MLVQYLRTMWPVRSSAKHYGCGYWAERAALEPSSLYGEGNPYPSIQILPRASSANLCTTTLHTHLPVECPGKASGDLLPQRGFNPSFAMAEWISGMVFELAHRSARAFCGDGVSVLNSSTNDE